MEERRVLEAVVQHQRPGPGGAGRRGAAGAVARHPAGRGCGQQQRLVAHLGRAKGVGIDRHRPGQPAAIAVGQEMHL